MIGAISGAGYSLYVIGWSMSAHNLNNALGRLVIKYYNLENPIGYNYIISCVSVHEEVASMVVAH